MTISLPEFIAALRAHQLLDDSLPYLRILEMFFRQWAVADDGATWLPPNQRDLPNAADVMLKIFRNATASECWVIQ